MIVVLEDDVAVECSAATIRPITLMQLGCKLVALRANQHLGMIASDIVPEQ